MTCQMSLGVKFIGISRSIWLNVIICAYQLRTNEMKHYSKMKNVLKNDLLKCIIFLCTMVAQV